MPINSPIRTLAPCTPCCSSSHLPLHLCGVLQPTPAHRQHRSAPADQSRPEQTRTKQSRAQAILIATYAKGVNYLPFLWSLRLFSFVLCCFGCSSSIGLHTRNRVRIIMHCTIVERISILYLSSMILTCLRYILVMHDPRMTLKSIKQGLSK